MTLTETIAEQRRLLAAATQGEWETYEDGSWWGVESKGDDSVNVMCTEWFGEPPEKAAAETRGDHAHIAAAHNALPGLLDALEAHRDALKALVEAQVMKGAFLNDQGNPTCVVCEWEITEHDPDCPLIAAEAVLAGWEA